MSNETIQLRGVEVHNLKGVDLDLPRGKLIVFCGLSGSGKTSLAVDTLYAEGQRRYIESFSAYTRQFLDQLEKPQAERIDGLPPAIAVTRGSSRQSSRSTVGTATEIYDYLRLLFAKIGRIYCPGCGAEVRAETPQNVAETLATLPEGRRYQIVFAVPAAELVEDEHATEQAVTAADRLAALREEGFVRAILAGQTLQLSDPVPEALAESTEMIYAVVDRLSVEPEVSSRAVESLETAFANGEGRCFVFLESDDDASSKAVRTMEVDGRRYQFRGYSEAMTCEDCERAFPTPEPRLFSFNSPLGACPECEGFGNVIDLDMELIVPDPAKSLRDGAVAPWNSKAYLHELEELIELAPDYDLLLDVPFSELSKKHLRIIQEGSPQHEFGGLAGFFAWLERHKYKMHIRVFLSRWRSYRKCPSCHGARLRDEALAVQVGGSSVADICKLEVRDAIKFFHDLELSERETHVGRMMIEEVTSRLSYLESVGLEYLALNRTIRTLSGGEAQRISLTSALGSSLVNMLYVLDEPSIGLHVRDVDRLVGAIEDLRARKNTVIVVEHEETLLRRADQIVEVGPGAGERGGEIVFQGTPEEMIECVDSLTGEYLSGHRGVSNPSKRRQPNNGWLRLAGARGNNLKNVTVELPLGVLCLVTGVSGSGKSTLVQDTLYPALCRRMRKDAPKPLACDDVFGDGQIEDCILVDQNPIGRSPRSNPVTYIKAFDEIRAVFADTTEARTNNYTASHFSFNVDGGRCNHCKGEGHIEIDMQFLADVYMKCPQCGGSRYRAEVLEARYRGRSIADVLEMTVRESFTFFRGKTKVQAKLKRLMDVGLDYVRLGQPASTLSGGEAQRLKLAGYMTSARRGRTLFILDEPTTGLHFSDIVQLLDCFDALLDVGHSLIVVEHNLQLMQAADHIIDLGPGAAADGGAVVAQGTPEEIVRSKDSITGKYLADVLKRAAENAVDEDETYAEEQTY